MHTVVFLSFLLSAPPGDSLLRQAAGRVEAGDPLGALALLADGRGREARYLSGRANELLGDPADAARDYAAALPGLRDEIGVRRGEMLLATSRYARAARVFLKVLRETRDRPSHFRRRALAGAVRAQARAGACAAAERTMWRISREEEVGIPSAAFLAIARCQERAGRLWDAAQRFDRLTVLRPNTPAARVARAALSALAAQGVRPRPLPVEEAIRAVRNLRRAKRFEEATARLMAIGDAGARERLARFERAELMRAKEDHSGAIRLLRSLFSERPREAGAAGYLRLAARCHRELGEEERAAEALLLADRFAPVGERRGRDLWLAGEALARAGLADRAADAFLKLARRERRHRDAPRAYLRAVEVLLDQGKPARATRIALKYPRFWRRGKGMWRVRWLAAWAALRAGDTKTARSRLRAIASARGVPAPQKLRARYWLARLREDEDPGRARAEYEALIREEPTAFYADLAAARLRELKGARAALATLRTGPPLRAARPPPFVNEHSLASDRGKPRPRRLQVSRAEAASILATLVRRHGDDLPDLRRALALFRLGLDRESKEALQAAQDEVERARQRPPNHRAFGAAMAEGSGWRAERGRRLARFDRAAFGLALAPVFEQLRATELAELNRRRFARAAEGLRARKAGPFPRAYEDLIRAASSTYNVDPALLFAIIRQESAFRTDALSRAGARGLLQIMPKTARRIAERLGEPLSQQLLDDPALSVRYGAWYLRQLLDKYRGQLPLAIAAYNAGPKKVSRWIDARGMLPLDAFLEEIPFAETRRYVRKVMRSLRTYSGRAGATSEPFAQSEIDPRYGDNINF